MKSLQLLVLLLFCAVTVHSQQIAGSGDAAIAQSLREGAWEAILSAVQQKSLTELSLIELGAAGYASYQTGNKGGAAQYFSRILERDSADRQALYFSALIYKEEEQCAKALPLLTKLCGTVTDVASYHTMLGDCQLALNNGRAAVITYRIAHNLSPAQAAITVKLANAMVATKQLPAADTLLRQAMALQKANPLLLNAAVRVAYLMKSYPRVSALTDSLLATGKPTQNALLTGLYADLEIKNYSHAVHLGEVSMALGGQSEDLLYYTAIAHQKLAHWKESGLLLQQCLAKSMKPQIGDYYCALADAAQGEGRLKQCSSFYDTAYYLFRQPQVLYLKARAMEEGGRKDLAIAAYRQYLALPVTLQDKSIAAYAKHLLQH